MTLYQQGKQYLEQARTAYNTIKECEHEIALIESQQNAIREDLPTGVSNSIHTSDISDTTASKAQQASKYDRELREWKEKRVELAELIQDINIEIALNSRLTLQQHIILDAFYIRIKEDKAIYKELGLSERTYYRRKKEAIIKIAERLNDENDSNI